MESRCKNINHRASLLVALWLYAATACGAQTQEQNQPPLPDQAPAQGQSSQPNLVDPQVDPQLRPPLTPVLNQHPPGGPTANPLLNLPGEPFPRMYNLQGGDATPPGDFGTTPVQKTGDFQVINEQAEIFRKKFLLSESIELQLPLPSELLPLGAKLPPIRLEASYTQPISLREAVRYAVDNTLDIRIQQENVESKKWLTIGSFSRYLPDWLMSYRSQLLAGSSLIGGVIPTTFHTPNVVAQAGFRMFGFQGGRVTFGALENLHKYKAEKQVLRGTINDVLLDVTKAYYEVVRNQAFLQIGTRGVEVSQAQLKLNQQLERAGTGTKFQVLQAETQLARDQQGLLSAEVALRRAALRLATLLNLNSSVNLLSVERDVRKVRLIDPNLDINTLISLAILYRPELKQFEQLRIAAARNVQVQAANLYPQFSFYGNVAGNGATLTRTYSVSQPSFTTVATRTPLANVTGVGADTQAVTTAETGVTIGQSTGNGAGPLLVTGSRFVPPERVGRQLRRSYTLGFLIDWNYPSLGVPDMANIQSSRALARQAMLKSNKALMDTLEQVRVSFLESQTAERQIEVVTKEVLSSAEQLRLSRVRLANGVGTNIDVINSQRDFTQALIRKAEAIIQFNTKQAQLLRDTGLISVDTLTSGRLTAR